MTTLYSLPGIDSIMREVEERFYNSFGSYIVSGFDVVVEDVVEVMGRDAESTA